jgi:iron complex outermembrane receptor protein
VSEVARVVELGYRAQPSSELNYSVTLFRHDWDRLRSGQKPLNALVQNMIEGVSYGAEAWGQWQPRDWLRFSGGLTLMRKDLHLKPGSLDPDGPRNLGNDPKVQWQLRTDLRLSSRQEMEIALRRVGALPYPQVPAYTALDLTYSHSLHRDLSLSVSGQNLLDRSHPEIAAAPDRSEIVRSVFVQLRWSPVF